MIIEALEKQRENIIQTQVAAGREFKVDTLFLFALFWDFLSNEIIVM